MDTAETLGYQLSSEDSSRETETQTGKALSLRQRTTVKNISINHGAA